MKSVERVHHLIGQDIFPMNSLASSSLLKYIFKEKYSLDKRRSGETKTPGIGNWKT
jgi:hypothetical protein